MIDHRKLPYVKYFSLSLVQAVEEAFVPVIKMNFDGIEVRDVYSTIFLYLNRLLSQIVLN